MILVIDGDYNDNSLTGHMACVMLNDIKDYSIMGFVTANIVNIQPYESGFFYKRELQGVEAILDKLNLNNVELIIIDGYATFRDGEHKAIGEYIYEKYSIPVLGIAKKKNTFCKINDTEVYRGKSNNPLYVTSVGLDLHIAKEIVRKMYGQYRLPNAVKLVDSLARKQAMQLEFI